MRKAAQFHSGNRNGTSANVPRRALTFQAAMDVNRARPLLAKSKLASLSTRHSGYGTVANLCLANIGLLKPLEIQSTSARGAAGVVVARGSNVAPTSGAELEITR